MGGKKGGGRVRTASTALTASFAALTVLTSCTTHPSGSPQLITIPPNASFAAVADSLHAHGIVRSRLWFKLVARIEGVDRSVQAGVYEFRPGAPATDVLAALAAGRTATTRLTMPEGFTIADLAALAAGRLGLPADSVVAAARDTAEVRALGLPGPSLEGFLSPDTYSLPVGATARELVRLLAENFKRHWGPAWTARLDTIGMTELEAVTLASIVEGEARVDEERATIAGVYRNRLRIGMGLQADPTVQYAILLETGHRKPRLYEKDYQIKSPYNTYLYRGLPPGPVNSPGRASIEAALYPADVPYLYFVATPDGHHLFSRTYDEHLRNVTRMRRLARAAPRVDSAR
ncbi:MAG TPA: endolytic transglycosylase MltG [Gemmatimonadales bacterium]|nr:endolytic transglycosylase MltG [Gemmatimonadales bacterium]